MNIKGSAYLLSFACLSRLEQYSMFLLVDVHVQGLIDVLCTSFVFMFTFERGCMYHTHVRVRLSVCMCLCVST